MLETIPLTKEGLETLRKELHNLKHVERPAIIEAIAEARGHGDLKENAEYHAAREKQGLIEARIADLDDKLSRAEVVAAPVRDVDKICFGAWVVLSDEETGESRKYRIVGDLEADVEKNKLSVSSPISRALLGRRVDDLVAIKAPGGVREYVVQSVEYAADQ